MSLLQAILLGIIQGLTEFLPISSSAHLVLVAFLFGWEIPAAQVFVFDVLVQMGTLIAVIIYFRIELWAIITAFVRSLLKGHPFSDANARLGWYLILATVPAGLLGLLIKDMVETVFHSPAATALFLYATTIILLVSERIGKKLRNLSSLTWKDALWIGAAQSLSIFPGISRSGSTIAGGLARNFERPQAARFSFLMSIPVMMAAGGLASLDLLEVPNLASFLPIIIAGVASAAVVGYLSIHWLLSYLAHHSLRVFAIYTAVIATLTLIVWYAR
jgi:undecaprenyl-diphosphatase